MTELGTGVGGLTFWRTVSAYLRVAEFVGLLFKAQLEARATLIEASLLFNVAPLLTLFPPVHLLHQLRLAVQHVDAAARTPVG